MPLDILDSLGLGSVGLTVVFITIVVFMFLIYFLKRYRKFRTNEFVIHLRSGKVKHAGAGGALFLIPIIDEVIIIPTMIQQTSLDASEKVVSREYQPISITGFVFWQVIDPTSAFSSVSWHPKSPDYVETVIRNAAESIIRTTCANMPIEEIIRERTNIIEAVIEELHSLMKDWGVVVHSVEVRDVEILDKSLKSNMEAVKQAEQEQKARLKEADVRLAVKTRQLQVDKETGLQDQRTKQAIQESSKSREIEVQRKEMERVAVAQETEKQRILIEAEATKQAQIIQAEADAQVATTKAESEAEAAKVRLVKDAEGQAAQIKEKLIAEAEGNKEVLLAQAEGQAQVIRQSALAEAEGLMEQAKALQEDPEGLLQLRLLQALPEVIKNMPKPDKLIVLSDENDPIKYLGQTAIALLAGVPDIFDKVKSAVTGELEDTP